MNIKIQRILKLLHDAAILQSEAYSLIRELDSKKPSVKDTKSTESITNYNKEGSHE